MAMKNLLVEVSHLSFFLYSFFFPLSINAVSFTIHYSTPLNLFHSSQMTGQSLFIFIFIFIFFIFSMHLVLFIYCLPSVCFFVFRPPPFSHSFSFLFFRAYTHTDVHKHIHTTSSSTPGFLISSAGVHAVEAAFGRVVARVAAAEGECTNHPLRQVPCAGRCYGGPCVNDLAWFFIFNGFYVYDLAFCNLL